MAEFAVLSGDFASGSEDIPDTFRIVPCDLGYMHVNVTAMFDPSTHTWKFEEMRALMVGYSSGAANCNGGTTFLEDVVRRCGAVFCTMFFDDGSLKDLSSVGKSAQASVNITFLKLRAPLSPKQQHKLEPTADFLG